jgi:hypothetical protein
VLMDDTPLPEELSHIQGLSGFRPLIREVRFCRRFPVLVRNARAVGTALLCVSTAAVVLLGAIYLSNRDRSIFSLFNIVMAGIAFLTTFLTAYTWRLASRSARLKQAMTRLVIEELKVRYTRGAQTVAKAAVVAGLVSPSMCPRCSVVLPTVTAKQCFACGADWHVHSEPS